MAKIDVNDELRVNGRLSFSRSLISEMINEKEVKSFVINGIFATHLYFEEINKLDSERYILEEIEVHSEDFGTDDYNILYNFTAKSLEIRGDEIDGASFILDGKEMELIENEMYKADHPILGGMGKEYTHLYIEREEEESE